MSRSLEPSLVLLFYSTCQKTPKNLVSNFGFWQRLLLCIVSAFKSKLGNVTMKQSMVWRTELLWIWWHHVSTRIIICILIITSTHKAFERSCFQEHLCLWNHTRESRYLSWWFQKCQISTWRSLIHTRRQHCSALER